MIDVSTTEAGDLKLTTRMICDEAIRRGWKAELYSRHSSFLRLTKPDGKQIVIYSAIPPTTSFIAAKASNDKFITQSILESADLPVLPSYVISSSEELAGVVSLFPDEQELVVKPLDSSHGNGVSVGVVGSEAVLRALELALRFSDAAVIQSFVPAAIDIRLACIDYKFTAGLIRQPAGVVGDGVRTVRQLIEHENRQEYRGINYTRKLNRIDLALAQEYLAGRVDAVLAPGERSNVVGTANVGTGGETHDITDVVPDWLIRMAESAARAIELPVCGVDFLVRSMPTPESTPDELRPVIIEINKGPALFIHETPTHGKARPVIAAYVDYLDKL